VPAVVEVNGVLRTMTPTKSFQDNDFSVILHQRILYKFMLRFNYPPFKVTGM
jgi:hypothetical protein